MKRVKRDSGKFEALELYTTLGQEHQYKLYAEEDVKAFMQSIGDSLKAAQNNDSLIHGKRIETLFKHLAVGLDGCQLVKTEDAGETFTSGESEVLPPDYKLILNDGRQIFVEVKNCNQPNPRSPYYFTKKYIDKVEKYGEMHGIPVYYAIYYRCLNQWTMIPKSAMRELERKYETGLIHSIANNEMSMLGDMMIGTKPDLTFELIVDKAKEVKTTDDNKTHFTIGDVKIYCDDVEVDNSEEKNIAFYLMRFGKWACSEPVGIMDNEDNLHSVQFTFSPETLELAEKQGFEFIGDLSSMITSAFNERTIYEQRVTSLDARMEDVFKVKIRKEYKGENLPLWLMSMQPNPDYHEGTAVVV